MSDEDTPERLKLRISILEYELEQMEKGKYLNACRAALQWSTAAFNWATCYPEDNNAEAALKLADEAIVKWTARIQEVVNPKKEEVIPD